MSDQLSKLRQYENVEAFLFQIEGSNFSMLFVIQKHFSSWKIIFKIAIKALKKELMKLRAKCNYLKMNCFVQLEFTS